MIRSLFLSLGWAFTLFTSSVFGQEAQTTTWKATLDAHGTKLRLELDITENDGQLTGEMRSLDQGNMGLAISEITHDENTLGFSVPMAGAKFNGELSEDGTTATGTFSQGGGSTPLVFTKAGSKSVVPKKVVKETLKDAWVGEMEIGLMKVIMQFRVVSLESGETTAYFDSVTEGQTGFEAKWSNDDGELKFEVPEIDLTFHGLLNESGDVAEGTWAQGGREIPLLLRRQATEYSNVNVWENRPQRPVAPFPYDAEEVTFENTIDGVTLAGTLTIPQQSGRHPVVVLISGSGPQDRDESLMEHKPFLVLADYLTRRGIAVLRYDDRGTAQSTGNFATATTEDFARDASAAVEFLKGHARINSVEIGLGGHSEGGLIAPMVVGLRDDVAFVVLLAATGVDGIAISLSQGDAMARAAGIEESEIELAQAINQAVFHAVKNSSPEAFSKDLDLAIEEIIDTLPESEREESGNAIHAQIAGVKSQMQSNWMRFFLLYDPVPALEKMQCPVLAIVGSKDLQVLPELNMPEIEKALTEGGNKDFDMVEVEGLNHLFQKCDTGSIAEYVTIQETFNPLALEIIGDWIIGHTTPIQ